MPCDSDLDLIFELEHMKKKNTSYGANKIQLSFIEETEYRFVNGWKNRFSSFLKKYKLINPVPISNVVINSYVQYLKEKSLLTTSFSLDAISVRGHFWHYDLMPSFEVFRKFLKIHSSLCSFLKQKYPDVDSENSVAVHVRDTDFSSHLSGTFPQTIMLNDEYYMRAINTVEGEMGSDVVYHLYSDNHERIQKLFRGKKIILHDDPPHVDWVGIFMSKNVIQSNSSFCWTSSLYNKLFSVQPKDGYNYYASSGSVPYGFAMPGSIMIPSKLK